MVNYYEKLNLDRSLSTEELNRELARLENLWIQRAINAPEKALAMQCLITEARGYFTDDNARREYDRQLEEDDRQPQQEDPDKERSKNFEKWLFQVMDYMESKQLDLAETAAEQALRYYDSDKDTPLFYSLISDIYRDRGKLDTALNYINKSIILSPNDSSMFVDKGIILNAMSKQKYLEPEQHDQFIQQERSAFRIAIDKAVDHKELCRATGCLAHAMFFETPQDAKAAEMLATQALSFGENENARLVLNTIAEIRQKKEAAEREAILKQQEADRAAEERRLAAADAAYRRQLEEKHQRELEDQKAPSMKAIKLSRKIGTLLLIFLSGNELLWILSLALSSPDLPFSFRFGHFPVDIPLWILAVSFLYIGLFRAPHSLSQKISILIFPVCRLITLPLLHRQFHIYEIPPISVLYALLPTIMVMIGNVIGNKTSLRRMD